MKTKKEKPSYNLFQNSAYIIRLAWRRNKKVLATIVAQIILAVSISTLAIFLPAVVVEQITGGAPLQTLVVTVLLFTTVTMLLQAANSYFVATEQMPRTGLRLSMLRDMLENFMSTDYANLEEKAFTDAKQKASDNLSSNHEATEQIYYCFKDLGIALLGFGVYLALLAAVNPLVLVIAAATSVLGAVARQLANRWRHKHDDENAMPGKHIWYIIELGTEYAKAKDIRLFAMTQWIKDLYNAGIKLRYAFTKKVQTRYFAADAADCVGVFIREGIAYAYLIMMVLRGEIPLDAFVLLFAAVGGFSGYITGILNHLAALARHSMGICRVREYLEYPNKFRRESGEEIPQAAAYALELKNVSFRYAGAEACALENINLRITPGEKLAVVGLNGAGKTTLVKLLCGLYDPTEGEVLLNGIDIRRFDRDKYYQLFTAVFQEFNIIPTSIAQNVHQGRGGIPAKMQKTLELAGISEKIASLPDGLDSLLVKEVNLEGVELSGGETQRLMLARALYKNAPILILDEPTAALDPIAESELYERYNALSHGRTSVYISHRLASTRFCDRIIMLEGKGISEMGTHEELMKQGGKYAELFEIQSKYYREEGVA